MTIFRQRSELSSGVFMDEYIISSSDPYYYVLQSRRPS